MTLQESDTTEFKRSFSQIEPSLKSVCGFLNHHGGVITFGRSDTGEVIGITPTDHSLRKLSQQITSRIKPEISPDIRVIEEKGVHLVTVTIPEGNNKPYFLDGVAYIRVGTENRVIPPDELKRMILTTGLPPWESEICPDATLDDIDPDLIREFLTRAEQYRRIQDPGTSIPDILDKLHLMKNGLPTNAAILLFGRNPQRFIIQSEVRCGHFQGSDLTSPFISMKVISGGIFNQINDTVNFILDNIRKSAWVPPKDTRREEHWEYPPDAIRESVINALCHRDYRSGGNVQVHIFSRHLEIWNPGKLPDEITLESLKTRHISMPRNRTLAQILFYAGFIEQWGSGTTKIVETCRVNGLKDPEFYEKDNTFSIVLHSSSIIVLLEDPTVLNIRQKEAIRYLQTNPYVSSPEYGKLFNCSPKTAQRDLSELESMNIVFKSGKTRTTVFTLNAKFMTFPAKNLDK